MAVERVSQALNRLTQREGLAHFISNLANPVLISVPLVLSVARRDTASWAETLWWGGLYLLLTALGPMALLILLAQRGRVASLHHARGRERLKPLLVSLACLGVAVALFQGLGAPPLFRRLAWVQLIQAVLMTAITPVWQISFHGAAVGALVTTAMLLYGARAWPLLGLLPLIGWSQVERGRHTVSQFAAGALLSLLLYGLGFSL